MAHRFLYKPYDWTFTCNLREDIIISVDNDSDSVQVVLTSPVGKVLFNERIYAIDGIATVANVGEIIEADLRSRNEIASGYMIALKDGDTIVDSFNMRSIYCDRYTPYTNFDAFFKENFLTTLSLRRIAPGAKVSLFYFARAGESKASRITFKYRVNGSHETKLGVMQSSGLNITISDAGVYQIQFDESSAKSYLRMLPGHSADEDIEIVEYTIAVGARSVTFFVDPSLKLEDSFCFRNCFNVWEEAFFPYATTAKTEKESSVAVVNDRAMLYNRLLKKSYETETGALTADEAEWIDQLLGSHCVQRIVKTELSDDHDTLKDIIITDVSFDYAEDDKPASAKFTWRYADNRPLVRLSASPGIFTEQFNNAFS